MKAPIFLLISVALAGCASAPVAVESEHLFADTLFAGPAEPVREGEVFALSASMRDYLDQQIAQRIRRKGPRLGLLDALRDDLRIAYDAAMTRNAAQTFEARSGNCLSLVIMTASLAKQLDIPVQYQRVYGQDTWTRSGGVAFHSNHVNLVLGSPKPVDRVVIGSDSALIVDFLPPDQVAGASARRIPEEMVVAMYMNNRAAEMVAEGDIEGAYWWVRAAIKAVPSFWSAYNTLGVIYLRHGNSLEAEQAFRYALEREPDNIEALSNLAQVLTRQGQAAEAQALRERLAQIEPVPPFHFLDQGIAAMTRGDDKAAIALLKKELARRPYDDEVHFALAVAHLRLGDVRPARKHLRLAVENSTTRSRHAVYAAKLEHLKSLQEN